MPQAAMPHVYLTIAMIAIAFIGVYSMSLVVNYVNVKCEEAELNVIASDLSARLSRVYMIANLTPSNEVFIYEEVKLPKEVNQKPYEITLEYNEENGLWYVVAYLSVRNLTQGKAPVANLTRLQVTPVDLPGNVIFALPLKSNIGKPVVWAWKKEGETTAGLGYLEVS